MMNFFKQNEKRILILVAAALLGLTGLRMAISLTLEPGENFVIENENGEPIKWLTWLSIEGPPVKERVALHPKEMPWSFEGFTGKYDRESVWRGLQVYREVCRNCHSLDYVAFRNLPEIMVGPHATPEEMKAAENAAKAIAASYQVPSIDEFGDDAERPATLTDYFPSPFPNEVAAMASNGGKVPPDLSLITKARMNGPNYVYSLLTGYEDPPADFEALSDTTTYNPYFDGWEIGMAPPLYEGAVTYADGTEASVEQMAVDVTNFLMWAAEPKLEARHEMGFKVVVYTLLMTIIFFLSMKAIWRRVKK